MNIYQLKDIPDEFKTLTLNVMSLAEQLGSKKLTRQLRMQPATNESLSSIWKENVRGQFSDVLGKGSMIPDISCWRGTYLVLSPKGYHYLKEPLSSEGEFLPIQVEDTTFHVFNCLSFGLENEPLCVKKYLDGFEDGLETLHFDEDDIEPRFLFKSQLQGCSVLYATDSFKQLYDENGLTGLRFDSDLLTPF
ncbi:hypothetical protein MSP8886_01827 [Marinomonas spartinae]|uniref:Uncharacterized protein n=1 Tax=Marinomonas spartinae TaxID=1792290 RepID=A0A1A8TCK5_9GAMM|nr:hypothetical protein [Marinomonas spartinae]SBS30483.1 hypothetical protein MSP8886_01827 [Marinomonas spartinae]